MSNDILEQKAYRKRVLKDVIYEQQYKQKISFFMVMFTGAGLAGVIVAYFLTDNSLSWFMLSIFLNFPIYRYVVEDKKVDFYSVLVVSYYIKFIRRFRIVKIG